MCPVCAGGPVYLADNEEYENVRLGLGSHQLIAHGTDIVAANKRLGENTNERERQQERGEGGEKKRGKSPRWKR